MYIMIQDQETSAHAFTHERYCTYTMFKAGADEMVAAF